MTFKSSVMKTGIMSILLFFMVAVTAAPVQKSDTVVVIKDHKVVLTEHRANVSKNLFLMGMQGKFFLYPKSKPRTKKNREVMIVE